MNKPEERLHALSVVGLSFQPGHRDKIDTSEPWYKVMDTIKHQPNFTYVCKGELIDDELEIVLFIAWGNGANAPTAFLSGDLDCIFSPLAPFMSRDPRLMGNLYRTMNGHNPRAFVTSGAGMKFIGEMMTICGPASAVQPVLGEIEVEIRRYLHMQGVSYDFFNIIELSLMNSRLFHLGDDGRERDNGRERSDEASFMLHLEWKGLTQRSEFHDVNIPDKALADHIREHFPSDFWQKTVVEPLEKSGATTSSWFFHKTEIARDEKWRDLVA